MKRLSLENELKTNAYPGRGIVVGKTPNAKFAAVAYFIMGRSENSRNRVFEEDGTGIRTQARDPSKLSDPSLIIYSPVRTAKNLTIVTNGDQTDTIFDFINRGDSFENALKTRTFEPDAPNFTPRISAMLDIGAGGFKYAMSIIKKGHDSGSCCRYYFDYESPANGEGRFIHTYMHDGNPLPSFEGEPKPVDVPDDMEAFGGLIWESLNFDNKISLFVRYIDLYDGSCRTKIYNKY